MKKIFLLTITAISIAFTSCKKKPKTLQGYLIAKQEQSKFTTLDFSTNLLPLQLKEGASKTDEKTLESIRKINIAFLANNKATTEEIKQEKTILKEILKSSEYKKLISFKKEGVHVSVFYTGKTEAIDEIILSGYGKKFGVGVARLLGEKMDPTALMNMVQNGNFDINQSFINKIKNFN